MKLSRTIAAICALTLLAACAGGNFAPVSSQAPPDGATGAVGTLLLQVKVPQGVSRPHRMRPHYVSAATKGMKMSFTGASTVTSAVVLTADNSKCSVNGSNLVCNVSVQLTAGKYAAKLQLYDKAPVGGKIPGAAHLLSTATNVSFTIVKGKSTAKKFTPAGVPASITVEGIVGGTYGVAFATPAPMTVTVNDAGGYTIMGTYSTPVVLTDSDTSGATTIVTAGSDNPPSGKLLSSSDTATFNYNGDPLASAIIRAAGPGQVHSKPVTFDVTVPAFSKTGSSQSYVVPPGVTSITVTAAGAQGGDGNGVPSELGGHGGDVTATIAVTPGESLDIEVGGAGSINGPGYNGGGTSVAGGSPLCSGGAGGGASDVRQGGSALANRVIVAGGGGGASCGGGGGGGNGGNPGTGGGNSNGTGGGGATVNGAGSGGAGDVYASSGLDGTLGIGGAAGNADYGWGAGGGGGGYYGGGGGGGGYHGGGGGGGGGSSFAENSATSVTFDTGTQTGDGQITITY